MKKKLSVMMAAVLVMVSILVPLSVGATGAVPSVSQEVPSVSETTAPSGAGIEISLVKSNDRGDILTTEILGGIFASEIAQGDFTAEDLEAIYIYRVIYPSELEGQPYTITFKPGTVPFADPTYVLCNYGDGWSRIGATRTSDGGMKVTVYGSCHLAFVVDAYNVTISADAPTSPATN